MRILVAILFLIASCPAVGQAPQKFYTRFGGDGDDIGNSCKPTADGQYIVAGSSTSYFTNGMSDVYLVKVGYSGFPMWQKFFGGIGQDVARSVIQLPDSGYVIAGFTNSFGNGGYDIYLIRTDKEGNMIWQKTFGGPEWEFAADLVQDSDGNIIVIGTTSSFGKGKKDGIFLKYDLLGTLITSKFFGGLENDELRAIIKTKDNLLATVGVSESFGDVNGDGYFLKLNLNGDTLFTKRIGGPFKDYLNDLVQKNDSDYIIVGAKSYSSIAKTRCYAGRFSKTGVKLSDTTQVNSLADESYVSVANSPTYTYVTGMLRNLPKAGVGMQGGYFSYYPSWYEYAIHEFGGNGEEMCFSIEATPYEGFVMVGFTTSFESLGQDVYLMKVNDSVVVNYSSVVGVDEFENAKSPSVSYIDANSVLITFNSLEKPEKLVVRDLFGRVLRDVELKNYGSTVQINMNDIQQEFVIFQYQYSDGYSKFDKIFSR